MENDTGTLWVDRYYIAYQLGDGDIHYVYLTKHHIREEIISYQTASKERGIKVELSVDIRKQFARALKWMAGSAKDIWINPEFDYEKKFS